MGVIFGHNLRHAMLLHTRSNGRILYMKLLGVFVKRTSQTSQKNIDRDQTTRAQDRWTTSGTDDSDPCHLPLDSSVCI